MRNDCLKKGLVIGTILLFVGANNVSALNRNLSINSKSLNCGNTFYVGGSGPGNYTKIQDAINASSDGDSIFVYDDSSPYHENLIVEKSITLTGESKETTVIDGNGASNIGIIYVAADFVTIKGFYIKAEAENNQAIFVTKVNVSSGVRDTLQKVRIDENIIQTDFIGIFFIRVNYAIIDRNYIEGCQWSGIVLMLSSHNIISNNTIVNNNIGVNLDLERTPFFRLHFLQNRFGDNTFTGNRITANTIGIQINGGLGTLPTRILRNNITDNEKGISIQGGKTEISQNNFLNNQEHAYFTILTPFCFTNHFVENYWGKPMTTPVRINGEFNLVFFIPIYMPRIGYITEELRLLHISMIVFDWHPAKEPYKIIGL